ncbi:MAG: hypothetical protein EXR49_09320 [Dehalococcoidia bacterium]|nr:hypothetical protein [Dehalococcoidia bacterium]
MRWGAKESQVQSSTGPQGGRTLNGALATLLTAMAPVGELRAAIPLGMLTHDLSWQQAFLWGVLGNLIPVPLLLWGLEPGSRLVRRIAPPVGWLLDWRAARLRRKSDSWVQRWGVWGLLPFVAVPLPLTGAWTGCLVAWAFGMDRRRALAATVLGVAGAGVIVTALVQAGVHFPFVKS